MNKLNKKFLDIILRYAILALFAIGGLWIFYFIFTPLTIYPIYFIFNLFFNTFIDGTTIYTKNFPIEIIKACVAGSAYYLLLIFNLSTPEIKFKQRFKMIFFAFLIFLIVNIIRIFILSLLYINNSSLFEMMHILSWYAGSVLFVILIWFIQVKLNKIREIPVYSDLKFLYKYSLFKK